MRKLVGIMGSGMIGRDPFDPHAWSGSSRYFFEACRRAGLLHRAIGVEVAPVRRALLLLRNFSPDRRSWRQRFRLDADYYAALTRAIGRRLTPGDFEHDLLQIGAIYRVADLAAGRCRCFSYHDGNMAQLIRSPFFSAAVSESAIARAMAYERSVYEGLDCIFTMSDYLRRSMIEDFGAAERKVRTIGAGVNLDRLPEPVAKDYGRPEVLFVGVDFERKGGPLALEAFRIARQRIPNARLHVVGPPRPAAPPEAAEGVTFHGFVSRSTTEGRDRFARLFRDCSLFVMPSLYEPFGIAPLEAMAHQIPCLLPRAWAFPEMVTPGRNGELAEVGDVGDFAEKMTALLRDPDRLGAMGRAARDAVAGKFTWDHVVARLEAEARVQN